MLRGWGNACFGLAFALGCGSMRARSLALGAHAAPALSQAAPVELVLSRALPIQIEDDFQPSVLAWYDGHLLTVSDKHDAAVYELLLEGDTARLRPFVTFEPPSDELTRLDLEGLSVADHGRLLVVSAAAENDARFAYVDRVYGLGEGLAITEDQIVVVLDNNQQARVAGAADRRPILLVFERPRDL